MFNSTDLRVESASVNDVYKDIVRVHEIKRTDDGGHLITEGTLCKIMARDRSTLAFLSEPSVTGRSIHAYLRERLIQSDADVVLYDHGPGELADFVGFRIGHGHVRISFYHCKASSDIVPGGRVADAYEVCGQAVKCDKWADRRVLEAVRRRLDRRDSTSHFDKGSLELLERALNPPNEIVFCSNR